MKKSQPKSGKDNVSKKVAKFIERKKAYCARFSNFMRFFVARDSS